MKKSAAPKQNIKNDTCIECRRDIKALTLLADTTSSGNLFHSWTTRTEQIILTNSNSVIRIVGPRVSYTVTSRTV